MLPSAGRRAFLTTGRRGLAAFAALDQMWFLIRCASPPADPLPAARHVIVARVPGDASSEGSIMARHRIDVLVTKNSGGTLTAGKLTAARQAGIPVIMVRRPPLLMFLPVRPPPALWSGTCARPPDPDEVPRLVPPFISQLAGHLRAG